ncbi:MAG: glycosyltransferase family 2 protein [Acidobacteria bacterium]|nr:glycosyltransferase family 2 protein [Acidobacteriota bacterium]
MNRISVTVITLNEERTLPRALASVAGLADEIVLVDSGSTDRTRELAREHGARVLERPWTNYSEQKNFAAARASNDWIFNLDADEELSLELRAELERWKTHELQAAGYEMPRGARYLGAWIRHSGWYPDFKLRLYRRDRARFVGWLHESVEVEGRVERLRGELYHHTFTSLAEHVAQINTYTTLAARELYAAGHRHWLLPLLFSPPWMLFRTFLLQQGFRDGYRGWLIANVTALSSFLKYAKLAALRHGETLPESASAPAQSSTPEPAERVESR